MFQRLKQHFTPATFISLIALVFAVSGVSYAATGGGGGGGRGNNKLTAQTSKSKRGPRGPQGPPGKNGTNGLNGAPGAQGPAGPVGPAGPAGERGKEGKAGGPGKVGEPGESGEQGPEGKEGSPWTDGGTLPEKTGMGVPATETGTWTVEYPASSAPPESGQRVYKDVYFSFPIPLSAAAAAGINTDYVTLEEQNKDEVPAGCEAEVNKVKTKGSAADPLAAPGTLCVYETVTIKSVIYEEDGERELRREALEPGEEAPKFEGFRSSGTGGSGVGTAGAVGNAKYKGEHEEEYEENGQKKFRYTQFLPVETYGTWALTAPAGP
jgi:hypothetical protein